MTKILQIPASPQIPNMLFKDDANNIKQVTDGASKIAFAQSDSAKQPVYNYGDGEPYMEFDGVDDYLASSESFTPITNKFTIEFYINLTSSSGHLMGVYPIGSPSWFILVSGTTLTFYYSQNGTSSGNSTTYDIGTGWKHIAFINDGDVIVLAVDGIRKNRFVSTWSIFEQDAPLWIATSENRNSGGGSVPQFEMYGLNIYSSDIYSTGATAGDILFTPKKPFTWLKRYQNKEDNIKLFLTSNNFDGAEIDSDTNEITSINNDIDNYTIKVIAGEPSATTFTPKGIKLTNAINPIINASNPGFDALQVAQYNIGTNDFFIGGWYMKEVVGSTAATFFAQRNGTYVNYAFYPNYPNEANVTFMFANQLYTYTFAYGLNKYRYPCILRKDGYVYFLIGGFIIDTFFDDTDLVPGSTSTQIYIGTQLNQDSGIAYVDDILFALSSIIDPTGFTVGQKVFEPPKRKSLNSGGYQGREFIREAVGNGTAKLYLNSRYTKDSVIDGTTGEVTSIQSDVNSSKISMIADTVGQEPTMTNKGLLFGVTKTERLFAYNTDINVVGQLDTFNENSSVFFSCWMNNTVHGPNQYFMQFTTDFTPFYIRLVNSNGILSAFCGDTSNPIQVTGLAINRFYHIAVSFDKSTFYLYLNGVLIGSKAHSFSDRESKLSINVGAYDNNTYGHFIGYLDDVFLSVDDSIIDPTGFSVGDKVFTPPRRSSSQPWQITDKEHTY